MLLDLDGTLLDLAFDNLFLVAPHPRDAYARVAVPEPEEAREQLKPRFKACEGTLDWYCMDYWSRELGLDVPALKRAAGERIGWLPGAEDFLQRAAGKGKRLVLMTNAHPEALRIKDERTGVTRLFRCACTARTRSGRRRKTRRSGSACAKSSPSIRERSMFVDDSPRCCGRRALPASAGSMRCAGPIARGAPRVTIENRPTADRVADFERQP